MARGIEGNEIATRRPSSKPPASLQKQGSKQQSIAGFFQKRIAAPAGATTPAKRPSDPSKTTGVQATSSDVDLPLAFSGGVAASSSPPVALQASQGSTVGSGPDKENGVSSSY